MVETLNVYKGEELIKSAEYLEGQATVTIDSLKADTIYEAGTYTVTRKNDNGESEKVDIPEFKTKPIAVSDVTLEPEELTLEVGEEGVVKATVSPSTATNKSFKLDSDNEEVATVDEHGHISAVAPGQTDITITTDDGGKTAKTKVIVNQPQSDLEESDDLEQTE